MIYRNNWLELASGWRGPSFKVAAAGYFDNRPQITASLGYGAMYLSLPLHTKYDECDPPEYGFYFFDRQFVICHGRKTHHFDLPWALKFLRYGRLKADGVTWETEYAGKRKGVRDDERWPEGYFYRQQVPFAYKLKDGEVQQRTATISVEEREWRPLWTRWLPVLRTVNRVIDVEFSDEVGEETGSWKGGVTRCSYRMLPGETPEQSLQRMARERKF